MVIEDVQHPDWLAHLSAAVQAEYSRELIDLRPIRDRCDDMLFVVRKPFPHRTGIDPKTAEPRAWSRLHWTDSMMGDLRIITAQRELQVSRVIRRAESLFVFPPAIGLVIGTFAAMAFVHLQLEERRRLYPDVSLLVHDDASPRRDELQRLCSVKSLE